MASLIVKDCVQPFSCHSMYSSDGLIRTILLYSVAADVHRINNCIGIVTTAPQTVPLKSARMETRTG